MENSHLPDDNYDNDDLITLQIGMESIHLYISQLIKYSKRARDEYSFSDISKQLTEDLQKIERQYKLSTENIIFFFQLLEQNFNMNENLVLTFQQCIDLLKITEYLKVRKLSVKINEYLKNHNIDVDFIIQIILHEVNSNLNTDDDNCQQFQINPQMEELLTSRIEDTIQNEKFALLPISIIYRIIEKSSKINSDLLFNFISKSITKYFVLLPFLDTETLSENQLERMIDAYSNSDLEVKKLFNHMNCQLGLINKLKVHQTELEEKLNKSEKSEKQTESEMKEVKKLLVDSEQERNQLKNELESLKTQITQLQNQLKNNEREKEMFKGKLNDCEIFKRKLNDCEKEKEMFQGKLSDCEKVKRELEREKEELLKNRCKIDGKITAKVKNGLLINADINLIEKGGTLDTSKSKYIVSTSNTETLGPSAYTKGETITGINQTTVDFGCKPGTYYVRAIVFDNDSKWTEIVSNAVTTNGRSILFGYEGKSSAVCLPKGKYKLEVWGAQGGNSTKANGGLGGYSSGFLSLSEQEKLFIVVGGQGQIASSSEGTITNGGFPDGGKTKTGLYQNINVVPGTGGGSTSIRITTDSVYSRVIVAGGGGGGSGCESHKNHGGVGGGMNGGNCYYYGILRGEGGGTQTGSSCGKGTKKNGNAGRFGQGADGEYLPGRASGGAGGGGWYGGGSGGCGSDFCSSGGGGSGWIFTESTYNAWKSGDSSNSRQFNLNSTYYLTEGRTLAGNEAFDTINETEKETGHQGNGYAKITPV